MATKHDLMAKMTAHIGSANGIKCADLALQLDITEREVRRLITMLINEDGIGICGFPATGYYIASNAQELQNTVKFHVGRAKHELKKARALRKSVLPDLLGQIRIKE